MQIRPFRFEASKEMALPKDATLDLLHPGYPSRNVIARLPRFDKGNDGAWGIHRGTLTTIAFILSGNRAGELLPSLAQLDSSALASADEDNLNDEEILTGPQYYFYPYDWSPADVPYSIVRSFDDYEFPHGQLPQAWHSLLPPPSAGGEYSASLYSAAVRARDDYCRISGFPDGLEVAHFVPKEVANWFQRNQMALYNDKPGLSHNYQVSDIRNCLLIRADIHKVFEGKRGFVFVPKGGNIVLHFIVQTRDLGNVYHNRQPAHLQVSAEFLFARLAWAVIPLSTMFTTVPRRRIKIYRTETDTYEDVEYSPLPASSRTQKKRPRGQQADDNMVADSIQKHAETPPQQIKIYASESELAITEERFDALYYSLPPETRYNLGYYPGIFRIEKLKQAYLCEHEGELHAQEMARQRAELAHITQ